ncbi:MAG: putative Ig domain-containing protein, partial [Betaproteobacteria bacterium]|nr:putative Ig domain-containing protein [Betaproteobacteria bacterium]
DPDADDALALTATLADGSPLPSWLTFNSASRSFSGAPGIGNLGSLGIRVTATDLLGDQVDDTFVLTVTAAPGQTFTGTSGNDTLTGMSGDDTLDGGAGSDTMRGGKGNDIYIVGSTGDKVFENAGEGSDEIRSSVTFTLSANVENLILTGTSAINGTGNDLDNVLIGNSAKNTLKGGLGNDTYFVSSTDVVTETANQGIDTVSSGGTWTLGSNLENLLLTGTTAINGTGNTLSNYLRGNTANNTLKGGTGIDLLEGGAGNDTLSDSTASDRGYFNGGAGTDTLTGGSGAEIFIGGTGNDTLGTGSGADVIVFNLGDGQDTVTSAAGQDNTISSVAASATRI